jgi:hypothetical protein
MIKVDEQKMIGRENRPMKDKINKLINIRLWLTSIFQMTMENKAMLTFILLVCTRGLL